MIYTVTFNPSLDYIVSVKDFKLWNTNRTDTELMLPGGKGLNVSTVLKNLGMDSTALGFTAGFVGDEILRRIETIGFKSDFIKLEKGCSRINLKLKNYDGTEINGQGPVIEPTHIEALLQKLDQLQEGDILILAGSIPTSMPASTYEDILARLQNRKILTVVDATKDLLTNVLKYHQMCIRDRLSGRWSFLPIKKYLFLSPPFLSSSDMIIFMNILFSQKIPSILSLIHI